MQKPKFAVGSRVEVMFTPATCPKGDRHGEIKAITWTRISSPYPVSGYNYTVCLDVKGNHIQVREHDLMVDMRQATIIDD